MPRTSKRLAGPALVATGPATIYTAPAGQKSKLKQILVNNPSVAPVELTLSVGADAAGTRFFTQSIPAKVAGAPSDSYKTYYADVTLEAGEIITATAGTNNILVIILNGEEAV